MRVYSESFKKSVVKKVLSEGVVMKEVAKKLNIKYATLRNWMKVYRNEVEPDQLDLESIINNCREKNVDIDFLLESSEAIQKESEKEKLFDVDRLLKSDKKPEQYSLHEKLIIVETYNKQSENNKGLWLREKGLYSQYIQLWEKEILIMAKRKIDESEELKKLREENRKLKKELKKSQRNEKELKILVELKKKYKDLFEDNEED